MNEAVLASFEGVAPRHSPHVSSLSCCSPVGLIGNVSASPRFMPGPCWLDTHWGFPTRSRRLSRLWKGELPNVTQFLQADCRGMLRICQHDSHSRSFPEIFGEPRGRLIGCHCFRATYGWLISWHCILVETIALHYGEPRAPLVQGLELCFGPPAAPSFLARLVLPCRT